MGYWDKYLSGSSDTSSAQGSTPAADTSSQNYDSTPQADPNNPWGDTPATPSEETPKPKQEEGQDALVTESQESEKAPEPERNANTQQAVADVTGQSQTQTQTAAPAQTDSVATWGQQNGLSSERINDLQQFQSYSPAEQQQILAYAQQHGMTDFLGDVNSWNQYTSSASATATQQATQPAVQNDEGAAALQAASNTADPNGIYDPSKTYGRQENGSYVFSNSAAQLQRDLNRLTNAGLTVDGYFGEKTQQALNNYLSQFNQPQAQQTGTEGADALAQSASEAETAAQPENSPQNTPEATNGFNPLQTLRDGWNALFNYNGTPTATQSQPESTPAPIRDSATDSDMARAEQRDQRRLQAEEAAELEREAERQNILNGNQNVTPTAPVMQVSGASNNNPTLGEALSAQTFGNGFAPPQQLVTPPQGTLATQGNTDTQQSPFPTPTSNGYVSTADFNANDYRNQLEQMENEPSRPMTGNSMSEALENRQPDRTMPRGYSTPANESLAGNSYSEARSRAQENQEQDTNIFRDDYQAMLEDMENEEPESTIPDVLPTPKAGASMAGNSYSRALADNQARPDTNIFRQDAPDVDEFRRGYEESLNRQNRSPDVQYGQQFMNDMRQLRQQFPTYSDTALFDMALFNEEMRNGQSSYYKWMANQLG